VHRYGIQEIDDLGRTLFSDDMLEMESINNDDDLTKRLKQGTDDALKGRGRFV